MDGGNNSRCLRAYEEHCAEEAESEGGPYRQAERSSDLVPVEEQPNVCKCERSNNAAASEHPVRGRDPARDCGVAHGLGRPERNSDLEDLALRPTSWMRVLSQLIVLSGMVQLYAGALC